VAEANLQEANQAVQAAEKQLTKERQTLAKADQALKDSDIVARTEKMIDRLVAERASHEAILAEKQQLGRITSDDLEQARVPIISVTFSADGRQLAIGNQHHKLFIYDAHAGLPLNRYFSRANALVHASYIDAHRVATIDNQRHLIVRESQAHWILHKTLGSPKLDSPITDRVLALDFSPDGKLLAVGSGEPSRNGQISIWNVADGTRITELSQPHDDTVFALAFSPDGRHLASSSADRLMKVFQVADGQFVRSFEGHTHHALDVEWRASGKQLATSGADKQIKIWDFSSGEQLRTIDGPGKEINAISFLGTGNQLVSVSGDRQIRIHNVDDGKQVRSFSGESNYLFCCCATEIGDTIVTGGADLALRVWSTIDGKERFVFYEETVAP
jgi:WD40 repeat protein